MPQSTITIQMDEDDFDHLTITSMRWAGHGWEDHVNRFEAVRGAPDAPLPYSRKMAYWIGGSWTDVILARSYLAAIGQEYDIVWDDAENPDPGYVILTDFENRAWREAENKVLLIEANSDLVYARLADGPLWSFGPVTPGMYGEFRDLAAWWADGTWAPSEGGGQHLAEWAEGMAVAAVLDTSSMEVFYPGTDGPDSLGDAARLWLLGKDLNGG